MNYNIIMSDADIEASKIRPLGECKVILLRNGLNTFDRALFSHTFKGTE